MAVHFAEQIMVALLAKLKAAPVAAVQPADVERDRTEPVETAVPAIGLEMAADVVIEGSDENVAFIDSLLDIGIDIYAKNTTGLSTELNLIRKEVHQAIMADYQQGLPTIIIDTRYLGADEPELEGALENAAAKQRLNYTIRYRHSLTDPSA